MKKIILKWRKFQKLQQHSENIGAKCHMVKTQQKGPEAIKVAVLTSKRGPFLEFFYAKKL